VRPLTDELWKRRYEVVQSTLPAWSPSAPDRAIYVTNESGSFQVHALELASGQRRRVSGEQVGILTDSRNDPQLTPDAGAIVWFRDPSGDEAGVWVTQRFEGGATTVLLPDLPHAWPSGFAIGRRIVVAALGDDDGFTLYSAQRDGEGWGPAQMLHHHTELVEVARPEFGGRNNAGLSADEDLVCVEHAAHGDNLHPSLRVVDPVSGDVVGEQHDGEGYALFGRAWSPMTGDKRLAIRQERTGWWRPAIWDLATGERREIDARVEGEVDVLDWWPDASALLIVVTHEGRDRLYRLDIDTEDLTPLEHPVGCVLGAQVRPDGEVWLRHESSTSPSRIVVAASGEEPLGLTSDAPIAEPVRSWTFSKSDATSVHGFFVAPEGSGPFPLVMDVHGGPEWLWRDDWRPDVQALVDAGFAVAMVNYRGSTGHGSAWRDSLIGNVGFFEIEDTLAGLDDLVARGLVDPERVVLAGKSWGGYITLLGVGMHPDRWVAGVADVPVGDYAMAYVDSAPALQAWDRCFCKGAPPDIPEFIAPRSPITYADKVSVPVLVLVGENDSRCPPRQVHHYVKTARSLGADVREYSYATGHSSYVVEEEIRQMQAVLDFLAEVVEGGAS
jgi:dienelactone hydrolase